MQEAGVAGPPLVMMVALGALTLLRFVFMATTSFVTSCRRCSAYREASRLGRRATFDIVASIAIACASGCGGSSVPPIVAEPNVAEIREIAAEHLRCAPERVSVVVTSTIVSCSEREDQPTTPRRPRPLQRGRALLGQTIAWR